MKAVAGLRGMVEVQIVGGCKCGIAEVLLEIGGTLDSGMVVKCKEGHPIVLDFWSPAERSDFYRKALGPMEWTGAVGKGWKDLVTIAVMWVESRGGEVQQVKEKFGELRVYAVGLEKADQKILQTLVARSAQICEFCGREGKISGPGWLKCRCDACKEEQEKKRKEEKI